MNKDFYHIRKVDTHIHHSACMTSMLFLKFIKKKLQVYKNKQTEPLTIVTEKGETLQEVFEKLGLK